MKKVLILSNYGMGLYKFRRELISRLCSVYDVSICIPKGEYDQTLKDLGAKVININLNRRGKNPVQELGLLKNYIRTIKSIHPDVVLTYTIKPNVYGGLACRMTKTQYIPNITGLGTAVENGGLLGVISRKLYKAGLKKAKCVFFQNRSNRDLFVKKKLFCGNSRLIPGSGVNLQEHAYSDYPEDSKGKTKLLFVGRIMRDKGISELLAALDLLARDNEKVFLDIVGEYDEDYSNALKAYEKTGQIKYHGLQQDVRPFYKSAHCVVLPSYHEGMANVLLEAAATGRPVVASNIPGCQETFVEGETGFGCKVKDAESLFAALKRFLALPFEKRREMGIKGREKMECEFDRNLIVKAYMEEIEKNDLRGNSVNLYNKLLSGEEKLSLIGLGYVGMPIAVAFAKRVGVIGYDLNKSKIDLYKTGVDPTNEVGDQAIKETSVEFTSNEEKLREAKFHIVAVPTPVNNDHTPDLEPVKGASEILGRNLTKGSVVVFESTVYPGVTEDVCVPILEKESGLKCGEDFKIGYSPERINPGDKVHRLESITKIVSGMDEETLDCVANVYELVVEAGVHRAESIKVAEAAKVIENSQRDINIAFMNELSIIFNKMGIDTKAVLEAAGTKWNFLKFSPGLVGGHCIGVDPYYLTYKAEMLGYHSEVILAGRRINDDMGKYVAENCVKNLIAVDKAVKGAKVAILGFTFKENCPDTRNTKVIDIVNELKEYGINPIISDPQADAAEANRLYGVEFCATNDIKGMDAVILAVAHTEFCQFKMDDIDGFFGDDKKVLLDIKGLLNRKEYELAGYKYWRL